MCAFPPPKGLGLDQTTKGTKRGAAEEEDRKQSHPKLPPPFSLLCNLLIHCGWEPDTLHLRKGPGLPSRAACGERPPLPFLLPSRGAQVFLLRPLGGEGRLAATSLAPLCHSALPRCVWSPVLGVIYERGPLSPSCVTCPRGLPAPVLWRCLCPRVRDAALRSQFPFGSGVCMGKSLCQLCHWVMWRGEGTDSGELPTRRSVGLPAPGVTQ